MSDYLNSIVNFLTTHPALSPVCSATITAIVAGVIALFTIKKQRQTARENNSLSFEKDYKRCEYVRKAWDIVIDRVIKNRLSIPVERYTEPELSRSDEGRAIKDILNEWERAANAVNSKLYDDEFLFKAFGSTVIFLRTAFGPYIEARQKEGPSYYEHFMKMSLRWVIRRDAEPNKKNKKEVHNQCRCRKCKKLAKV